MGFRDWFFCLVGSDIGNRHHTFAALLVMRIVLGIGESVAYPSYTKIFATHFVESRRGVANSSIGAGQSLGPGLGMLFGGTLVASFGWRPFFIGLGAVSLLWLAPWLQWMPRTNSRPKEGPILGPGMVEIMRQRSAWSTWIGLFCANYFLYFLLTWLPLYLVDERHYSMVAMSKIGGSTFLMAALSSLVRGRLADRWVSAGATVTRVRKTFVALGATLAGLFVGGAVLAPPKLSVALLLLAGTSFGLTSSNLNAVAQTLAGPHAAGRWMGLQNFVGNLAGWVAPALTGILVERTGHFYWPFFITTFVAWIGALNWLFLLPRVEPVIWKTAVKTLVPHIAEGIEPSPAPIP